MRLIINADVEKLSKDERLKIFSYIFDNGSYPLDTNVTLTLINLLGGWSKFIALQPKVLNQDATVVKNKLFSSDDGIDQFYEQHKQKILSCLDAVAESTGRAALKDDISELCHAKDTEIFDAMNGEDDQISIETKTGLILYAYGLIATTYRDFDTKHA